MTDREPDPAPEEEPEPRVLNGPVSTGADASERSIEEQDEIVDEASEESFPASDPPAY